MDSDAIFGWLELLDTLDYYALLNVDRAAQEDDVKRAFHTFANTFHPDAHAAREEDERRALDAIFKRGTEAYMVLTDPGLRAQYDAQLASSKPDAPPRLATVPPPNVRASQLPPKLEDKVRSPSARPFARRAEELAQAGDLKQAKLQMVMARHHDPDNDALEQYMRDIEEQLRAKR